MYYFSVPKRAMESRNMKTTRIAIVQVKPEINALEKNTQKLLDFLEQAVRGEASLVVFPECSLTGYSTKDARDLAIDPENEAVLKIREYCCEHRIAACFGYVLKEGDNLYIAQELFSGEQSICYRKTHLGSKEQQVFTAGECFPVLKAPLTTGMQLCWESHIPEISASERKQGAELLLVPYASMMSGERCSENWSVHLPARASDNGCFLAACNLLFDPEEEGKPYRGGGLAVYDPKGRKIAEYFGTEEKMILCDLEGVLPREIPEGDMHNISYFDRKREELF